MKKLTAKTRQCDFPPELKVNSNNGDANCYDDECFEEGLDMPNANKFEICRDCVYDKLTMGESSCFEYYKGSTYGY